MTEDHITRVQEPDGSTHTTIIRESEPARRSGGGMGMILFALVLVAALVVGAMLLSRGQNAEIAKDNAVADAAQKVGDSAAQAGQAVEDAADKVTGNN